MAQPFVTKEQFKKGGGGGGGSGGASATAIAPAWEQDHHYYEGDVISKGSKIYECLNEINYSWDFNSELSQGYWQETTVFDSIIGLLNTEM